MTADDDYRVQLWEALHESGATMLEPVEASDRLRALNPDMQFQAVRELSGQRLLLSDGCAVSPHSDRFKTEFVIAQSGDFDRRVLEYVAHFHLTRRHVTFAE